MAKIYQIPVNFNQSGYIFNGLIETRRAIEAGAGALIGFLICRLLPLSGIASISVYLFVMLILGALGYFGIRGELISSYVVYVWKWRKIRKKPYLYNPNGEAFAISAAQVHMDETAIQDVVADVLDDLRSKFDKAPPEYIEGKTFVFAEDPLAEKIRSAQEEMDEDEDEYEDDYEAGEHDAPNTADETPDGAGGLDLDGLIGSIITHEGDGQDG
jgi:hypothetical protein